MYKFLIIILLIASNTFSYGQDSTQLKSLSNLLQRTCIDINAKAGWLNLQNIGLNLTGYGTDYITNNSVLKFAKQQLGTAVGGDINIGYFMGKRKRLGIGFGIFYAEQKGSFTIDSFHVEYKNVDAWGNPYRQIITANNLQNTPQTRGTFTENITIQHFSIPVLLKYRHQFANRFGISADAGAMLNLLVTNSYNTNAVFDYEALYAYDKTNKNYYYNTTTNANGYANNYTWLITQANVRDIQGYFSNKQSEGFNVGSQQAPTTKTGTTQFLNPTIGILSQLNLTYQFTQRTILMIGGFYAINNIIAKTNNTSGNWKLTDSIGSYRAIINATNTGITTSFGINIGLRFFIGGTKDIDNDGIPDNIDDCILNAGPGGDFAGCPDFDGDGIPDKDDACPYEKGPSCTNGCPDRDNDCIADKVDACPDEWGFLKNHGCFYSLDHKNGNKKIATDDDDITNDTAFMIDSTNNRTQDYLNYQSKVTLTNKEFGTTEKRDTAYINETEESIINKPLIVLKTTNINFGKGKNELDAKTYKSLDEAVEILKKDKKLSILVAGYTDDIGSQDYNILLSYQRAENIQKYLISKGIYDKRVILSGYGKKYPAVKGTSSEARAKNRRIEIKIVYVMSK